MAMNEVRTDLWVATQLDENKIKIDAQGSEFKEVNEALNSASKLGTTIAAVIHEWVAKHLAMLMEGNSL